MKVIGISGSSGAGKTTLSKILNEREDVKVIDADKIVREMSVPGTTYLNAIQEAFGDEIFFEDGSLNRKSLASKIYNNDSEREKLNSITFKYVVEEMKKRINDLRGENLKFIIIDAPLLFESNLDKCCDYVIALVADNDLKIKRICDRDGIDEETAKARLNIQHDNEFYTSKSDFVIFNEKGCDLRKEIDLIFNKI